MKDLFADLNPEQRAAVEQTEGPLLILAGAGSGKTRVITRRVAYLLQKGVRPWEIFAVTFTNKAAGEMKERVAHLVGPDARRILVSTFHSACARFLREDIPVLGYGKTFTIYDSDDQARLLKHVSEELGVNTEKYSPGRIRWAIDQAKNRLWSPADLAARPLIPGRAVDLNDPSPRVYERYQKALREHNAVDFNDLVNMMVQILEEFPEVRRRYQQRFRYLMVDEYQDTNHAQYRLIQLLAEDGSPNLAVVGDDDQSIYAFRGADIRNIQSFQHDYPATVIVLGTNYRSTKNIFDAATSIVKNNPHRIPGKDQIRPAAGPGEPVRLLTAESEQEEAALVLKEIRWLVRQGLTAGDIAIIFRTNAASRLLEQALTSVSIPYVLVGGRRFFEREEIKDILAYVRLVLNPADEVSLLRAVAAPSRGVGPKALEAIRAEAQSRGVPMLEGMKVWAAGGGKARAGGAAFVKLIGALQGVAMAVSPSELVARVIEDSGYADMLRSDGSPPALAKLDNLDELVRAVDQAAAEGEIDEELSDPVLRLQAFVDRAALVAGADELPTEGGRITMLTAHLAKGLEFPVVFVVGMNEGGFPHFRSLERVEDVEEERRLVYVAFTRAERRLYLSRARTRLAFDPARRPSLRPAEPSRFLSELDPRVLAYGSASVTSTSRPPTPPPSRMGLPLSKVMPAAPARPAPRASASGEPEEAVGRTFVPDSPNAFQPGVRVIHPQLGRGVIQERQGAPGNPKLVILFDKMGRRTLIALHARLEIELP